MEGKLFNEYVLMCMSVCACMHVCFFKTAITYQIGYIKGISIRRHVFTVSFKAGALRMAVALKAESQPAWRWWVDNTPQFC